MADPRLDPAAVALLDRLPAWDADTYAEHKEQMAAGLTRPGGALIAEVARRLDADLTTAPRASVSPLHRDLRFAPPGADRYKDHLLLKAWQGEDRKLAPTLWIRIDATGGGFASGMQFTPEHLERWREAVAGDAGADLAATIDALAEDHGLDVAGQELKRVPKPYDPDHPRADLLRHKAVQVRYREDLPEALDDGFTGWCVDRLDALLPVHRWLLTHVVEGSPP